MSTTMIKTQVYLDQDQFGSLKYFAAQSKTSYAQLIRDAVSSYLEKVGHSNEKINWSKRANRVSTSMGGDLSQNIDEELYK